jgi:hypothetical protein
MAPTYPECDAADLAATLRAVADLDPITIYHEPINIRAENVARIEAHAKSLGARLNTSVFRTTADWRNYALESLHTVERLANQIGVGDRLHLWPDQSLGSQIALSTMADPAGHQAWLQHWWSRISELAANPRRAKGRETYYEKNHQLEAV